MSVFWVYAALLTSLALAILITPLVRARARSGASVSRAASNLTVFRDQIAELDADLAAGTIGRDQWEAARGDLQRGLLEGSADDAAAIAEAPVARSKVTAVVVAVAVPLVAVLVYLALGSPQGLDPNRAIAPQAQGAPHELSQEQIESMVAGLAKRLESNPDDVEGWTMLARTYSALGRFSEAAGAYAKAEARFPRDAQLLADYADSLAMAQGQNLQGKPEALIRRALQADGNNLKALALAGTVEFEKRDFAKAVEYWKRMVPLLPPDSEMLNSVSASIKEAQDKQGSASKSVIALAQDKQGGASKSVIALAQEKQGGAPKSATVLAQEKQGGAAKASTVAANAAQVSGTIILAPALAARAAPDDTVFVLARPAQGSRMPLAAVRVKVKDLPFAFSFDDTMAMNPSAKLSDFAEVVVAARVSKTGNVVPQGGDLEGASKAVRPGAAGITVEIAKVIP